MPKKRMSAARRALSMLGNMASLRAERLYVKPSTRKPRSRSKSTKY